MNRTSLLLCVTLAFNTLVFGQTANKPDEDLSLPEWSEADKAANMSGTWWTKTAVLLPTPTQKEEPAGNAPIIITGNDIVAVDPLPEDFSKVHPHFLPGYIQPKQGLSDPQLLLDEIESVDVIDAIKCIQDQQQIALYVSVFAPNQEIPPSINAPTLGRQVFQQGQRSALVHFHLNNLDNLQIYLDPSLNEALGIDGSYKLLYEIKQQAAKYSEPTDQIIEALATIGNYVAKHATNDQNSKLGIQLQSPEDTIDGVPKVNIKLEPKVKNEEKPFKALLLGILDQILSYGWTLIGAVLGFLALITALILWRRFRKIRLLRSESDIRLAAPHGASQSRLYDYSQPDGQSPQSVGRKQMRDHIKSSS